MPPMHFNGQSMGIPYGNVVPSPTNYNSSQVLPRSPPSPYFFISPSQQNPSSPPFAVPVPVAQPSFQRTIPFQHPGRVIQQNGMRFAPNPSFDRIPRSALYPPQRSLKRQYPPTTTTYPSKYSNIEYPFTSIQSSIEDLASQQLQRNEMDGIIQERTSSPQTTVKNYASYLVMNNPMWSADDTTMILYAMYRVLLQSKPDAPNEFMIQIPITCSNLLPPLINQFAPCQLQNGNTVKLVMKQLAFQLQQQQITPEPPFIDYSVFLSLKNRRKSKESNPKKISNMESTDSLNRSDLVFTIITELNTTDKRKEFYLKEYLRCLFLNNIKPAAFIHSFTIFFYDQVEECLEYEQNCRVGELSQLIINTRNLQTNDTSSSSNEYRLNGIGFAYHYHLDFLLSFCSRYFIRPFSKTLFLAILNFFRTTIVLSTFNSISKCIYSIILTQPELAMDAIHFFIHTWPFRDSSREVLYLRQVECIVQMVSLDQQQTILSMIFNILQKAIQSPNRFVSLQSIQFLMRIVQTNLSILDCKMVSQLSNTLSSLENHWCETIRQCASSCLKCMLLKAELRSSGEEDALSNREEAFTS